MNIGPKGFSLIELLVVAGLVAGLSFLLLNGLGGPGQSAALQVAQSVMAGMVTAARTNAMASGKSSRLLVQVDPASANQPARYLRYVAVQTQADGGWLTVADIFLPDGVYIVPGNFASLPDGLFATEVSTPWTRTDGSALRSTALRSNQITLEAINSSSAEEWAGITISGNPGTAQSGDIVLATGRQRPPGSFNPGESPIELINPDSVCGLTVSSYAVPALINARSGF